MNSTRASIEATPDVMAALHQSSVQESVALQTFGDASGTAIILADEPTSNHIAIELPPYDRGREAWGYLAGAFLLEALCWGFPFSFGIFQNYYSTHASFKDARLISAIGTAGSGVTYLEAPLVTRIIGRYPRYRRLTMYLGLSVCFISCLSASFCSEVWQLILTQGVIYGIGSGFLYLSAFSYVNEWFVHRRGLASGVIFGGAGASGLLLPLLFEKLLTTYGYQVTLRAWAVIMVVLTIPTVHFLIRGRLPASHVTIAHRVDLSFFKNPFFLLVGFSNLLQGLGFFIPSIYLPSYASDLSMTSLQSTLVLSMLNLATVFGQLVVGILSDRFGAMLPLLYSTLIGAGSVCILWGLSKSFALLLAFSLVYGLTAGGYSVLWSQFALDIAREDPNTQLTLYGVFAFQRGIGNVIAGPISSVLVVAKEHTASYAIRKYEGMVLFTGITMILSSWGIFARLFKGQVAAPRSSVT